MHFHKFMSCHHSVQNTKTFIRYPLYPHESVLYRFGCHFPLATLPEAQQTHDVESVTWVIFQLRKIENNLSQKHRHRHSVICCICVFAFVYLHLCICICVWDTWAYQFRYPRTKSPQKMYCLYGLKHHIVEKWWRTDPASLFQLIDSAHPIPRMGRVIMCGLELSLMVVLSRL